MKKENYTLLAEKYYPSYPDGVITREISALRDGFIKGCIVQSEKNITKEAYEDCLNMQRCSNAGYESKIIELKRELENIKQIKQNLVSNN